MLALRMKDARKRRGGSSAIPKPIGLKTTTGLGSVKADSSSHQGQLATDHHRAAKQPRPRKSLSGGFFRSLNEELYASTGAVMYKKLQGDPSLFDEYHKGYRNQAAQWPINPVDHIIKWLRDNPDLKRIGDFGCGDAKIYDKFKSDRFVFSCDLVAAKPAVHSCPMHDTPLKSSCLDVAIFCLSLMGRDWPMAVEEAYRVLRPGGTLLIAEVLSRYRDVKAFVEALRPQFHHVRSTELHGYFLVQEFVKVAVRPSVVTKNRRKSVRAQSRHFLDPRLARLYKFAIAIRHQCASAAMRSSPNPRSNGILARKFDPGLLGICTYKKR